MQLKDLIAERDQLINWMMQNAKYGFDHYNHRFFSQVTEYHNMNSMIAHYSELVGMANRDNGQNGAVTKYYCTNKEFAEKMVRILKLHKLIKSTQEHNGNVLMGKLYLP